jgi:hypothetical protein
MKNLTSPERVRQDCRLLSQTLLKLALPRLIMQMLIGIAVGLVGLFIASWLLAYGKTVDYGFLHTLGRPTVDFLGRLNPYLWWIVTGVWSLLAFAALRHWLGASVASGRAIPVAPQVLAELASRLSDDVLSVMRWTWSSQEEPFTVGDLRRSLSEVRSGRIAKIAMVREQTEALSAVQRSHAATTSLPLRS